MVAGGGLDMMGDGDGGKDDHANRLCDDDVRVDRVGSCSVLPYVWEYVHILHTCPCICM